jgi:ion channel-forming bestrophin family protein
MQLPPLFCTFCGWVTPLAMLALVFLFLGLDSISGEIENPFGYDWNDLPIGTALILSIAAVGVKMA